MPFSDSATIVAVDPTAFRPGSDFGPRYRIEALLGEGGMGRVYKAYDKELDRIVAIKIVRPGVVGEAGALARFKQELVLASKISHKNILRIHDMGEVAGMKFITMAYVEGRDLHHIIHEQGKLPIERVLKFAQQLAGALSAAHAENVVHRDLKPQNVLVDVNDQVYIADFGLAKSYAEGAVGMTQTGAFLGTPRYMSPEQVEGKPTDGRSDLYSYGLILYEMLTGDVPFTGESTIKVMYQRIQEKPKSPRAINPEVPAWLDRVVMRCLERDPKDRYQDGHEILGELQVQSVGGVSRRGAASIQIQLPQFRNRRWIWVVGSVVAVVILAFAIAPLRRLILGSKKQSSSLSEVPRLSSFGKGGKSTVPGVPPLSDGRFVGVLPLQVLGDSSQLGYVAQGIEEALSTKLFQLKDVRVASQDEAAKVDSQLPLPKIARALGTNLLVQGVLQGAGDKIRVTINLEDVADGQRLWSGEFDGVVADLFTLEDQIYNQLVSALSLNPSNDERAMAGNRPTDNVAAYGLYLRGRNSLRGHDAKSIQSALDYFDQALRTDPKFALAYTGIADASLRMNSFRRDSSWTQKALAAAQQAQALNDSLPEVHTMLGMVYRATGRYAEAVAELSRAVSLAPNSDEAYRQLGNTYMKTGNGPAAIEALQKATQLNPYYYGDQNSLGSAYFKMGDYAKALSAFQRIIELQPDIDLGYENVGNVYFQQGKYQESIPYYQKAVKIAPFATTYSNLGTAYFFLKQYSNAIEMFEKAATISPNDTLAALNLADAYRSAGQRDKALDAYKRAISLGYRELQTNPQDSDVMSEMALAYANLGDSQNAGTFIKRARAVDKNSVEYIYIQAEVYALLGKTSDSLKALQESLEKHYPAESVERDVVLDSLRSSPEYAALIKKYSTK
jgi:serine/threonine protein kinase/tetratricopeptide (TPR) repeat protein